MAPVGVRSGVPRLGRKMALYAAREPRPWEQRRSRELDSPRFDLTGSRARGWARCESFVERAFGRPGLAWPRWERALSRKSGVAARCAACGHVRGPWTGV